MRLVSRKSILPAALCLITFIASVSTQCCDFDGNVCEWEIGVWKSSEDNTINTADYPNFRITQPGGNVLFDQDLIGSTTSGKQFYIGDVGTPISFYYYFALPSSVPPTGYDYLAVSIYNVDGSFTTALNLNDFSAPSDVWRIAEVTCDDSIGYCCGSIDKVPCYITVTFTGNLDSVYSQGLFAIDNFGVGETCP